MIIIKMIMIIIIIIIITTILLLLVFILSIYGASAFIKHKDGTLLFIYNVNGVGPKLHSHHTFIIVYLLSDMFWSLTLRQQMPIYPDTLTNLVGVLSKVWSKRPRSPVWRYAWNRLRRSHQIKLSQNYNVNLVWVSEGPFRSYSRKHFHHSIMFCSHLASVCLLHSFFQTLLA